MKQCKTTGQILQGHGKSQTREYYAWVQAMSRCNNQNHHKYEIYGARGIAVCERWSDPENFLADMGPCPQGYQLDRIDNNQGYYPENCHWVTPSKNARNRSTSKTWHIKGKVFDSISDAAKHFGVSISCVGFWVRGRNDKYNYPPLPDCWAVLKYKGGE